MEEEKEKRKVKSYKTLKYYKNLGPHSHLKMQLVVMSDVVRKEMSLVRDYRERNLVKKNK